MGISRIYNSGGFHTEAYYSINSLEREINDLKREISSIKSSISSLKDEIQKLEKSTKITLQGLENVTNTHNVNSTQQPAPIVPNPNERRRPRLSDMQKGAEYWMLFPPEFDENGIQWTRHKENGCWYYCDLSVSPRWNKSDS